MLRSEQIQLRGHVVLQAFNQFDKPIWRREQQNVVTNIGRQSVAMLLAGTGAGRSITRIGFGTSGAAALVTNTDLVNPFIKAIVSAVVSPDITAPSVQFNWRLEIGESNGKTIQEVGLFSDADAVLFSRLVQDPIIKDNSFYLVGTWTIAF